MEVLHVTFLFGFGFTGGSRGLVQAVNVRAVGGRAHDVAESAKSQDD